MLRRLLLFTASALALAAVLPAQRAQGADDLRKKRDAELKKPVFQKAPWLSDYDAARAQARKDDKLLLGYFTRSYLPCPPCEQLEAEVLGVDAFAQWSKKVVLFVHVTAQSPSDAPLADDRHPYLLYETGGNAWPTMSYLDADGNLLQQVGNPTTLDKLERAWQKLQTWKVLRAEVESGKAAAGKDKELFLLELQMGNRPFAEMEQRRGRFTFDPSEQQKVDQQLVNLQFTEVLRKTPRDDKAKGGAELLPMFQQGRIPDCATDTSYWEYLFAHAAQQRDVKLFEQLLATVKEKKAGDPRLKRYLHQLEDQLEDLKTRKG